MNQLLSIHGKVHVVFVALTPYQLLVSSLLVTEFASNLDNAEFSLIYHERVISTLSYFKTDIWSTMIHIRDIPWSPILKNPISWIKYKKSLSKEIKKILNEISEPMALVVYNDDYSYCQILMSYWKNTYKILADEGAGLYVTSLANTICKHNYLNTIKNYFNYSLGLPIKKIHFTENENINAILARHPLLIEKQVKKDRLVIQLNMDALFRNLPNIITKNLPMIITEESDKILLFMSQCLSEEQVVSINEELIFYDKLQSELKKYGMKLYIKPHPRDSNKKLNELGRYGKVLFDWREIPSEILLFQFKPYCLGTFNSNAVIDLLYQEVPIEKYFIFGYLIGIDISPFVKFEVASNKMILVKNWNDVSL